jgi:hypothetical protein
MARRRTPQATSSPETAPPTLTDSQLMTIAEIVAQKLAPAIKQNGISPQQSEPIAPVTTDQDSPPGSDMSLSVDLESVSQERDLLATTIEAIRTNLATIPPQYVLLIYDPVRPNDPLLHSSMDFLYAGAILLQMFDRAFPDQGLAQAADKLMQFYAQSRQG